MITNQRSVSYDQPIRDEYDYDQPIRDQLPEHVDHLVLASTDEGLLCDPLNSLDRLSVTRNDQSLGAVTPPDVDCVIIATWSQQNIKF